MLSGSQVIQLFPLKFHPNCQLAKTRLAKTSKVSNRRNFRSCEDIEFKLSGLFSITE